MNGNVARRHGAGSSVGDAWALGWAWVGPGGGRHTHTSGVYRTWELRAGNPIQDHRPRSLRVIGEQI
eukprot:3093-Prymnesium_polylepis.3